MQSYCGLEQRQESPCFPAVTAPVSLRIFIVPQKMGIPITVSPTPLPYTPSCPQWSLARKTVLPTGKLIGASQKGKELKSPTDMNTDIDFMKITEGDKAFVREFENFVNGKMSSAEKMIGELLDAIKGMEIPEEY